MATENPIHRDYRSHFHQHPVVLFDSAWPPIVAVSFDWSIFSAWTENWSYFGWSCDLRKIWKWWILIKRQLSTYDKWDRMAKSECVGTSSISKLRSYFPIFVMPIPKLFLDPENPKIPKMPGISKLLILEYLGIPKILRSRKSQDSVKSLILNFNITRSQTSRNPENSGCL